MCSRVGGWCDTTVAGRCRRWELGILMVDRAPAGMGWKAKRMELAPCAVRSLGWVQSVGTVTVGVPLRPAHLTPQAGRTDDGQRHSHSDPQSVQLKVCSQREART